MSTYLVDIKPDVATLTSYMAVYADASRHKQALQIFNEFKSFGIVPTAKTYKVLVRMYIRLKDIKMAFQTKEDMKKLNLIPDNETYGILIESYTHRNMVVEALKELEESAEQGIHISERHIKQLRSRCKTLGVKHPNMPADPNQWIKDVKQVRKDKRHSSNRDIHRVQSAMFS